MVDGFSVVHERDSSSIPLFHFSAEERLRTLHERDTSKHP